MHHKNNFTLFILASALTLGRVVRQLP